MRDRSPSSAVHNDPAWTDEEQYVANVMTRDLPRNNSPDRGGFYQDAQCDVMSDSDSSHCGSCMLTPSTYARVPLSPVAAPFTSAAPHSLDRAEHNMDAIRFMASHLAQPPSYYSTRNLTNVTNPLYEYHALNSPPDMTSVQYPTAPSPQVTSTITPASDTDLAADVRNLRHLYHCQSRQLAAQQQDIDSLKNENHVLHSIFDQDRAVEALTEGLSRTNDKCAAVQKEVKSKDDQYRRASRELEKARIQALASKGGEVSASDSDIKVESMAEVQKMQSTSITAVFGQVMSLDRAVQAIAGALGLKIKVLSTTVLEQAQKIRDLEIDRDAMKKHAEAQEKTNKQLREETSKLLSTLTKPFKTLDSAVENFTNGIARMEDQGNLLRSAVDRIDTNVNRLQADAKGVQKRAQQQSVENDSALDQLRGELADLAKRADEAVVVADARSAALEAKVAELKDDVAATKVHAEHQLSQSATPGSTDAPTTLEAVGIAVTKMAAQLSELEDKTRGLDKGFGEWREDVDCLHNRLVANKKCVSAINEFEVVSKDLVDIRKKMEELEVQRRDAGWDAMSDVALEQIDNKLTALRNTTDSLAQTCKFPTTTFAKLGDFVTSSIKEMANKARNSQAREVSTITSAPDHLRQDLSKMVLEQNDKTSTAIGHSSDQSSLNPDFMSSIADLSRRVYEGLGTHGIQSSVLTTRIDDLAAKYQNNSNIRDASVTQATNAPWPFAAPHPPTNNHVQAIIDDSNPSALSAASRATAQARSQGLARGGAGMTRGASGSMRGRRGGDYRSIPPDGFW